VEDETTSSISFNKNKGSNSCEPRANNPCQKSLSLPVFIAVAVCKYKILQFFHYCLSCCIHKVERVSIIGLHKFVFGRKSRLSTLARAPCSDLVAFLCRMKAALAHSANGHLHGKGRESGLPVRRDLAYLEKPRPSIRTTIQVLGNKLSGCSNERTYSYLSFVSQEPDEHVFFLIGHATVGLALLT